MTTHSVEQHLGLKIEDYDREIRRLVPHYDELVSEGLELLRRLAPARPVVLDVGAGTGRMAAAVLDALPEARVILLDVDPTTLGEAKKRLATAGERADFVLGSFLEPLPACDAVVASLSLHHIRDLETKARVYRSIRESLPPGAPFLNLDASVSAEPTISKLTFDRWAASMATHGIAETAARQHFSDWASEEHYFSLADELTALRSAGFTNPEVFWRKGPLAIYGGLR